MTENEEIERYRKILEDWKPGPGPKAASKKSSPSFPETLESNQQTRSTASSSTPRRTTNVAAKGTFASGAILLLNEQTLALYQRAVPEKEYHLVCSLFPNGAVKTQGIALEGHYVEELGSLPKVWFDQLQNEMRWDRDLVVFHCYRYEDVLKIPKNLGLVEVEEKPQPARPASSAGPAPVETANQQAASPRARTPAQPKASNNGHGTPMLKRGQRVQIKFGSNAWDAIYWGKDEQGQVVAHRTHQTWSLMHLDLNRFKNELVVYPEVDQCLIDEITKCLLEKQES